MKMLNIGKKILNTNNNFSIFMRCPDELGLEDISKCVDISADRPCATCWDRDYTGIKLYHRKLTRKKFIKLVMARCEDKRRAEKIAEYAVKRYGSYLEAWYKNCCYVHLSKE